MKRDDKQFLELRRRAETLLHSPTSGKQLGKKAFQDLGSLLHEIEVHAVELELQNEELRLTRDQLEIARDRYQDLYDFAPLAYITLDANGIVKDANVAAAELLRRHRSRVLGRGFLNFVAEEDRGLLLHTLREQTQTDAPVTVELRILAEDGQTIHVQIGLLKTRDISENAKEFRLAVHDISERILLEQQRDMFFSVASHELRTPLTNIALSLDMVLAEDDGTLPPDTRDKLQIANRGTKRLKRLMEDILELRNLKTASWPIALNTLNLAALLTEAVELNGPLALEQGVRLKIEAIPAQAWIQGNEARLLQVFNNLLTNAMKFSPPDSEITARLMDRSPWYRVEIQDQGPGVPRSLGQRIFEPFTQGTPSLEDSRHKESRGLGLSISRHIVEHMGGHLDYLDSAGPGAIFFFDLPAHRL